MNRPRAEEERRAPAREQGNVGRVRHGSGLEAGNRVEALRRDVRSPLELGVSRGPLFDEGAHRFRRAHEAEHDFALGEPGHDVGLGASVEDAHVVGGVAEHRILGPLDRAQLAEEVEHRLDGRLPEVRIGGVRLAPADPHHDALRALAARRKSALGRFTVHEPLARGRQVIGCAGAVGALLLADEQQQVDALLAAFHEVLRGHEHGGRDSLGVTGAASVELVARERRRDVRWHRVEVRRERDRAASARGPDVAASRRDFLHRHVPSAGHEPAGHELHGLPLPARGGFDREKFGGKRDHVGHARKVRSSSPRWQRCVQRAIVQHAA